MAEACLTCGHEHRHHSGLANMIDCDIPGCTCTKFDPADPKIEQASDLQRAIHVATVALRDHDPAIGLSDPWAQPARIAVEAAYPLLLHATRDRHDALEVYAAELRGLLERSISGPADCWQCDMPGGYHLVDCPVAAALQTSGPARGHAILQENQRLREFERAVRAGANYNYDTLGMTQVDKALAVLDQAAQREVDSG